MKLDNYYSLEYLEDWPHIYRYNHKNCNMSNGKKKCDGNIRLIKSKKNVEVA